MDTIAPRAFSLPYVSNFRRNESLILCSLYWPDLHHRSLDHACTGNTVCLESDKEEWFKNPLLSSLCAAKEEMAVMPPTSVVVGELDMIRDMGIELYHRLKDAGVESLLAIMGGGIHEQQLFASHSPQVTNQSVHDLAGFASYVDSKES